MLKGREDYDPEEGVTIMGMDLDLAAGVVLVGVGLTGMAGKKNSEYLKYAGAGALSYWFGTFMEDKFLTRALESRQAA